MSTQVLSTREKAGQCPMQAYRSKWTRRTALAPIEKRRASCLNIQARKYGKEWKGLHLLVKYDRCRVATLLGLLVWRRPIINSQAGKYAYSHCMSVRGTHELQHGAAWRQERCIWRPSSLFRWELKQRTGLLPKAPILQCMQRRACGLHAPDFLNGLKPCRASESSVQKARKCSKHACFTYSENVKHNGAYLCLAAPAGSWGGCLCRARVCHTACLAEAGEQSLI